MIGRVSSMFTPGSTLTLCHSLLFIPGSTLHTSSSPRPVVSNHYLYSTSSAEDRELARSSWDYWRERLGVPYFDNSTETRVLSTIGKTSYLHCLVGNLGDRQVRI